MKTRSLFLLLAVSIPILIGISRVPAQGHYNKAAFDKTMEETNREMRILLGSLIAANFDRAASSAESIVENAAEIRSLTPKRNADRIEHFRATADSLAAQAGRLAAAAEAEDEERLSEALGETIGTCMHCHATFRD